MKSHIYIWNLFHGFSFHSISIRFINVFSNVYASAQIDNKSSDFFFFFLNDSFIISLDVSSYNFQYNLQIYLLLDIVNRTLSWKIKKVYYVKRLCFTIIKNVRMLLTFNQWKSFCAESSSKTLLICRWWTRAGRTCDYDFAFLIVCTCRDARRKSNICSSMHVAFLLMLSSAITIMQNNAD